MKKRALEWRRDKRKKSFIELKKLKHTKETIIIPAHSKKTTVMKWREIQKKKKKTEPRRSGRKTPASFRAAENIMSKYGAQLATIIIKLLFVTISAIPHTCSTHTVYSRPMHTQTMYRYFDTIQFGSVSIQFDSISTWLCAPKGRSSTLSYTRHTRVYGIQ